MVRPALGAHTDPHIVAGWRHPAELEPPLRPGSTRDFRKLNGLLNQPHGALGKWGYARPVSYCSVRAPPATGCSAMMSGRRWRTT